MQGVRRAPTPFHWLLIAGAVGFLLVLVAFSASGGFGSVPGLLPSPIRGGASSGAPAVVAPAAPPTASPSPTPSAAAAAGRGHHKGDGGQGSGSGGDGGD